MFVILSILITIAAISAGSFGGGGGGGAPASSKSSNGGGSISNISPNYIVSKEEADIYRTDEYKQQWGLEAIHAAEAYADLAKNGKAIAGDSVSGRAFPK